MTSTSGEIPDQTSFRLQTFGTLRLIGSSDDTVLGEHGHQRRRLALLAIVAASGTRGRSRDQLLGLLWPDASQEKARHSLDQLLYAIRTALGVNVFTAGNPLRLNRGSIGSDIGDFTNAIERGEQVLAVEMYRGPFLDGFYLSDAPEFEQWMESERSRIERFYMDALEMLAKNAEDARDFAAAARWREKLIETDPVSSKHATGLIRALMNAGDHAAALKYAKRYEEVLAQELGTSVGPAVAGLIAEARARAKADPPTARATVLPSSIVSEVTPRAAPVPAEQTTGSVIAEGTERVSSTPKLAGTDWRRSNLLPYGIAALTLFALIIAALLLRSHRGESARAPAGTSSSIAVLPLVNVGGDPRDAAVADGLSEELIGVVSRVQGLRVVAQASAFVFRNSTLDARKIADSLGVSNLLEGSVQKVGNRMRVQMRLVDGHDGSTRWSETYDRELKDIFVVQSEIASAVAQELDLQLTRRAVAAIRRAPTQNIAAYELYLRGSDPAQMRNDSTALLAVGYFKQAVALDSNYAAAYAGLARLYMRSLRMDRQLSPRNVLALGRAAGLKALALDDSLAEAHGAFGITLMRGYDFAGAAKEFNLSTRLDPGYSRVREWLGFLDYWMERPAEALAETNRAVQNDPLSPSAHAEVGRALCANGRYAEGLAELRKVDAVRPPLLRTSNFEGLCYAMERNWPDAITAFTRGRGAGRDAFVAYALARNGQRKEALAVLADLTKRHERNEARAFDLAVVNAGLGNYDETFKWLNKSIDDLSLDVNIMLPLFADVRSDPRFERIRDRLGLHKV